MAELTPDIVRLAYVLFLGRNPENEAVIRAALEYGTLEALRAAFLSSREFASVIRQTTPVAKPRLVPIGAPPIRVEWQVAPEEAEALLAHVRATWTRLGDERPHWSVLSAQAFTPEQIGANEAAFYSSGAEDLANLQGVLMRNGVAHSAYARIFEFGCGIGRVTPFLAGAFAHVEACDVSMTHMAMARATVERTGCINVTFSLVEDDRFGMTAPFDVWFSRIVLQHNAPPIIAMILTRALTLLAPGGTAVFQVPTYASEYSFEIAPYLSRLGDLGQIEMHVLPQPVILRIASACGCEALEVLEDMSAGPSSDWNSTTFVLRKRQPEVALSMPD